MIARNGKLPKLFKSKDRMEVRELYQLFQHIKLEILCELQERILVFKASKRTVQEMGVVTIIQK